MLCFFYIFLSFNAVLIGLIFSKDVKEEDLAIRVCIYAFDCLYLNGESLISQPFMKRREMLHNNFIPTDNEFAFAHYKDTSDAEEIQEFLNLAVQQSCEGLMVKTLETDAEYEPSKRSLNWLKCKKDYLDGVGDTLDLLVMGAFYGIGKRTGVYGCYLVGCYDAESEGYQSCCKVATGFSDEELLRLTEKLKPLVVAKKPMEYQSNLECDIWVEPKIVIEVKCADFTISPLHMAAVGSVNETKGIALRFPRYIKEREDKNIDQCTTSEQVVEFYQKQVQLQ